MNINIEDKKINQKDEDIECKEISKKDEDNEINKKDEDNEIDQKDKEIIILNDDGDKTETETETEEDTISNKEENIIPKKNLKPDNESIEQKKVFSEVRYKKKNIRNKINNTRNAPPLYFENKQNSSNTHNTEPRYSKNKQNNSNTNRQYFENKPRNEMNNNKNKIYDINSIDFEHIEYNEGFYRNIGSLSQHIKCLKYYYNYNNENIKTDSQKEMKEKILKFSTSIINEYKMMIRHIEPCTYEIAQPLLNGFNNDGRMYNSDIRYERKKYINSKFGEIINSIINRCKDNLFHCSKITIYSNNAYICSQYLKLSYFFSKFLTIMKIISENWRKEIFTLNKSN